MSELQARIIPGDADGSCHAYHLLSVAMEQFGTDVAGLDSEQRQRAEVIAHRKAAIEDKILSSERAQGVVIPAAVIEQGIEQIRARYQDDNSFEAALLSSGMKVTQLHGAIARELKVEAVMDRVAAEVPDTDALEASLYYYLNKQHFQKPETRTTRHILVTVNEEFPENTRENARQKISTIANRLQKKPERFAEQATKHSECPSAMNGGLLGKVRKGLLFPQLDKVLFTLKPGEISPIIETEVGLHLLRCEAIEAPGAMPLKEILPRLREKLSAEARAKYQREWLESL